MQPPSLQKNARHIIEIPWSTSGIAFVFTAILLTTLRVPAWLMLAFLAAVLDMVPVVGFLLTIVAIGLLSLSVSPMTALYACASTLLYQGIENYLISPRVYGSTMRLSNLAVLIAFAVGGILAGPLGVILALPIAAAAQRISNSNISIESKLNFINLK